MDEWKNNLTHNGIHASRYLASWINEGGNPHDPEMKRWLRESQKLTDEEIYNIVNLGTNGKMELETSVRLWIMKK